MDLSQIINNEGGDDKAAAAIAQRPTTPSSLSQQHPQLRHESSANENKLYNEYSSASAGRPSQPDLRTGSYEYDQSRQPSRHISVNADYQAQSRTPHQQFASPTPAYQRPPLHSATAPIPSAQSHNDFLSRSPRPSASYQAQPRSTQSPLYPRNNSGPFSYQSTNSPGQERVSVPHQSSGGSSIQRQESYPQPSISQYLTSPVPLTPPSAAGPTGGYPPFLQHQPHSRSLSSHSNSTPTSAHSQYNRSPLLASGYPAPVHQQQQRSQPGTPLGPPISIHRSGTYPPPQQHQQQYSADSRLSTSPYQSRQSLPPPPPPPSAQQQSQQDYERRISNETEQRRIYSYDGQVEPRPQSQAQQILQAHVPTSLPPQQGQYESRRPREQSLSVSPKTQPATRPSQKIQRQEPIYVPQPQAQHQVQASHQPQPQVRLQEQEYSMSKDTIDRRDKPDAGQKRKMERRSPERSDARDSEPPMQRRRRDETPDTEGETTTDERSPKVQRQKQVKKEAQSQTPQPQLKQKRPQPLDAEREEMARPKKRTRYTKDNIPIWARSWPEFVMVKKKNPGGTYYGIPVDSIGAPVVQNRASAPPQPNGITSRPPSQQPPQTNGASAKPSREEETSALLGFQWAESIADIPPPTSVTKEIADFLFMMVVNRNDWNQLNSNKIQVEVEAKLGTLIDKGTNQRLDLPVASEAVLAAGFGGGHGGMGSKVAFRSEMPEDVFKMGNKWLNERVEQSTQEGNGKEIKYLHRREIDTFYNLGTAALNTLPPAMQQFLNTPQTRNRGLKVRVSHDQKTGKEIARIVKARVADLDVYFPKGGLDCRISVNLEMGYDGDLPIDAGIKSNDDEGERRKDRLSYKQSGYTVDLTQVSSADKSSTHELEIEIDTDVLVQQGRRLLNGEKSAYVDFVDGLVGRVRTLIERMSG